MPYDCKEVSNSKGRFLVEIDMKFALKSIVAAAAFVAAGVASATPVTVSSGGTFNGLTATGSGTLSFSAELLSALDAGGIVVSSYAPAAGSVAFNADGTYASASAAAPITSLTLDSVTGQVLSAQTAGGLTQTATTKAGVTTGGSLTVTNLNVDLANKTVYATIIGGNGVGTLNNFALWTLVGTPTYDSQGNLLSNDPTTAIVGPTTVNGAGTYNNTFNGLSITTAGFNTFVQALGLLKNGKLALAGVDNFGTINSTIVATAAIPEPSTYALMGLGLVGMSLVARRRAK